MLKVLPVVGHSVVHVHRVPDEVRQKADGVLVVGDRLLDDHAAGGLVVAPGRGRDGLASGAVHHFPPAGDVVPGVGLHQFGADALHQGDGQGPFGGGVKGRHDVALLYFIGVGLGPGVVLAGGVVGGVDFGAGVFQFLGKVGAVTVTDGVGAPAVQQFQGLGHYVHIGGNGHAAAVLHFIHR